MTTHKVELPDGRLITIEGGNAESVANVITQRMGNTRLARNEEPLELPQMQFESRMQPAVVGHLVSNDEEPLVMPAMTF